MKRKNLLKTISAILLLLFIKCGAQSHRFIYDVIYKKDSTSNIYSKSNYNLDIFEKDVKYYKTDFFIADSLIQNNISFPTDLELNTSNIIEHKLGDNKFTEIDIIESTTVLRLSENVNQIWTISNEKKKIKDIKLQKAMCHWAGRNWVAWFTEEIPFATGPYKFHGLPGLIIELQDDKEDYKFSLVNSQNLKSKYNNYFIEMAKKLSIPVTWEKYKAVKIAFYKSPTSFIKNSNGDSVNSDVVLNNGTRVNVSNSRSIDEQIQYNLKTFNNPIELDKVIRY